MQYDEIMKATMLLCTYFNSAEVKNENLKPLSGAEYSKLALWLYQNKLTPADLLSNDGKVLEQWVDPQGKITTERLQALLGRGVSMAMALEKWNQQGIWVISRASELYPQAIKKHLGERRPPILFGLGNQQLLQNRSLGFVGSRRIGKDDELFTIEQAQKAVDQGFTVISGGAQGIDKVSMQAALEYGGNCIGLIAGGVYSNDNRRAFSRYLAEERLVLLSPFFPEAGFSVGNAMGRNKFIYIMSEAVVVVKSDKDKGGTWSGAVENLRNNWVPLLVRNASHDGNQALIDLGGIGFSGKEKSFSTLLANAADTQLVKKSLQSDLFADTVNDSHGAVNDNEKKLSGKSSTENKTSNIDKKEPQPTIATVHSGYGEIFELFVRTVKDIAANQPEFFTPKDIQVVFPELLESQIKRWLKDLEDSAHIKREGRRLQFSWIASTE